MSDDKPTAFDPDDVYWGFDVLANDVEIADITQPDPAKRQNGWTEKEKPPRAFFNWFWSRLVRIVIWLQSNQIRRFTDDDMSTAYTDTHMVVGDRFDVFSIALRQSLLLADSNTAIGGIVSPVTDGGVVYLLDGLTVTAFGIDDFVTPKWITTPDGANTPQRLACDGSSVFVGYSSGAANELHALGLDGTDNFQAVAVTGGIKSLASNGVYLFVANDDVNGTVDRRLPDLSTSGNNTHGATLYDIAVNSDRAFIVGRWNGANRDVVAFLGSTMGIDWSITLGFADPIGASSKIASDGEFVYVCGITDGSGKTLHKLNAYDGTLIWSVAVGTSTPDGICVDSEHVFVSDTSLWKVDKYTGSIVSIETIHTYNGRISTNGVQVFSDGNEFAVGPGLLVSWVGGPAKTYQRVAGDDKYRRPFYQQAIPAK